MLAQRHLLCLWISDRDFCHYFVSPTSLISLIISRFYIFFLSSAFRFAVSRLQPFSSWPPFSHLAFALDILFTHFTLMHALHSFLHSRSPHALVLTIVSCGPEMLLSIQRLDICFHPMCTRFHSTCTESVSIFRRFLVLLRHRLGGMWVFALKQKFFLYFSN